MVNANVLQYITKRIGSPSNKKMVTFLFWTATKTNYISKCSDFQKKLIDTITTSNFYLFKENNENDLAAQVFWAVFYSSRRPSQIGPTADFDGAAIPPPIFSMVNFKSIIRNWLFGDTCHLSRKTNDLKWHDAGHVPTCSPVCLMSTCRFLMTKKVTVPDVATLKDCGHVQNYTSQVL